MGLAHPAMHHSIQSLDCSSERSCDHPATGGDPEAALEVSALARRLPKDCHMPFAQEVGGPPLWPVLWWIVVQFRTTTPASYVYVQVRRGSVKLAFSVKGGERSRGKRLKLERSGCDVRRIRVYCY